jgi:hypothetical protein
LQLYSGTVELIESYRVSVHVLVEGGITCTLPKKCKEYQSSYLWLSAKDCNNV